LPAAYSYRRVSTGGQASDKKSGLERQEKALKLWLKQHKDFQLAEALIDPGMSAYSGKNRRRGALGLFLGEAEAGRIPRGSVLVVEDHRRFSRQEPLEALQVLIDGFWTQGLGFAVCSYDNGRPLFRENATAQHLAMLAFLFEQAHRESREKSNWSKGGWNKILEAQDRGERPRHRIPYWIVRDGEGYALNGHAKAIQRMFSLCIEGVAQTRIAETLNDEGIPPPPTKWGLATGRWTRGPVCQRLKDLAVTGALERKAASTIEGYYPAVVDLKTFRLAQRSLASRDQAKTRTRVQRGQFLFSGMVFCGGCGSRLVYVPSSKYSRPGHPGYLVCSDGAGSEAKKADQRCMCLLGGWRKIPTKNIPMDIVESALLATLQLTDWERMFPVQETREQQQLQEKERRLRAQVTDLEGMITRGEERLAGMMIAIEINTTQERVLTEQVEAWRSRLKPLQAQLLEASYKLSDLLAEDPKVRSRQTEARLKEFFSVDLGQREQRLKLTHWLKSLGVQWTIDHEIIEIRGPRRESLGPVRTYGWLGLELHAIRLLGPRDGVRFLVGSRQRRLEALILAGEQVNESHLFIRSDWLRGLTAKLGVALCKELRLDPPEGIEI
jgi:DNA invertase Pin-like site-specific DNA recombinase